MCQNIEEEIITVNKIESYIEVDVESCDEKFQHIMCYNWGKGRGPKLPNMFKLKDPYPGEPPFLKLRTQPAVLQIHKYNADKDPESYWFSEAILYLPHKDEEDLVKQIDEAKSGGPESWEIFVTKINHV